MNEQLPFGGESQKGYGPGKLGTTTVEARSTWSGGFGGVNQDLATRFGANSYTGVVSRAL